LISWKVSAPGAGRRVQGLVDEASDGVEAVRLASELSPDVVLMDLRMPGLGGIEAIEQIKATDPRVEIVILTTYDEDESIVRGLRVGARGCLLKDTGREALLNTIRRVRGGELALPQSVADRVVAHLGSPKAGPAEALSPREFEVLALIAQGAGNKQKA
jgi:DNA-binding NarL/FixJ family response regulator